MSAHHMQKNLNRAIRDLSNVTTAHDHVHPDRNDCGGVGGCLLMRTEHDAEQAAIAHLLYAARNGYEVRVTVEGAES